MDSWTTLRRHVPTAFAVVMLAGVALPAQAKDADKPRQSAPHAAKQPGKAKGKHVHGGPKQTGPVTPPQPPADEVAPAVPPVVKAPQPPGKDEAKEAKGRDGAKGKSALPARAAASKGKTGAAPSARTVNPIATPPAPPAPPPAATPAPPASQPQPGANDSDRAGLRESEPVDETVGRSGAGAGALGANREPDRDAAGPARPGARRDSRAARIPAAARCERQ